MRVSGRFKAVLACTACTVGAVLFGCGGSGGGSSNHSQLTPQQIIAQATPSVVRIEGSRGNGSGFIIDAAKGLVLTNAHVASGNTSLKAQIGDSPSNVTPAQLLAAAPCNDLAVLRLVTPPPGLKALTLGSSAGVKAGDQVTALGFPVSASTQAQQGSGTSTTVVATSGSVSVAHQQTSPGPSLPQYPDTIQMQTPISPGNSGGPLLDSQGQVIGVNSLASSSSSNAQAQNFAIAIDFAKRVLPSLEAGTSQANLGWRLTSVTASDPDLVSRLGAFFSQDTGTPYAQDAQGLAQKFAVQMQKNPPDSGLYDLGNEPGSPAEKAGVHEGYLVESVDGNPVQTVQDVCSAVVSASPGSTLRLGGRNIDATSSLSDGLKKWTADLTFPSH